MGHGDHGEALDTGEVTRIASMDAQAIGHRRCGGHRVVRAGGRLTAATTKRRSDLPKRSGGVRVEWQGLEFGFSPLKLSLPSRTFDVVSCHERTNRQLGEGDRRDHRVLGQHRLIDDPS